MQRFQGLLQSLIGRSVLPAQAPVEQAHAALQPAFPGPLETLAGQGVDDFVAQDDAAQALPGQPRNPLKTVAQVRMSAQQALALAGLHAGGGLDQQIAFRQPAATAQFAQQDFSQPAAAGTQFGDVAAVAAGHDFGALTGQGQPEQPRCLRSRIKIPAFAKICPTGAVIAVVGVVQRQLHVAVECQPAAGLGNGGGDVLRRRLGMGLDAAHYCYSILADCNYI